MSPHELLPITKEIYSQMSGLAWMMIGPLFLLSCVISYVKAPANFPALEMIHRIVVTIALLIFFPDITSAISEVANGLADRIGEKHALDALFLKIQTQTDPGRQSTSIPFLIKADFGVAILNYFSYAVVYIVKYLILALYHFFWSLLMAIAPLAILCNLFQGTSQVTKNLFSSMIEISCWNIIWQVLAVMLMGLSVLHPDIGNYFDAICFNFLVAIGLIGAPILVHSFVRGGLSSPASLSAGAVLGATLGPVGKSVGIARQVLGGARAVQQSYRHSNKKGGSDERSA